MSYVFMQKQNLPINRSEYYQDWAGKETGTGMSQLFYSTQVVGSVWDRLGHTGQAGGYRVGRTLVPMVAERQFISPNPLHVCREGPVESTLGLVVRTGKSPILCQY
jgi:hypothetical protein